MGMERANAVGLGVRSASRGWRRAFALALAGSLSLSLSSACGSVTESSSVVTCEDGGPKGSGGGGGQAGMSGSGGEGGIHPDLAIPDEVIVLPCTICVRAQNCCKAEGLTDCNYAAACAAASTAEQNQFYLPLCQGVLGAPHGGGKKTADACGF
jgi:hypothetical protein